MNVPSVLGGIAGAFALTVLNESARKFDKNAPRLDLLGMNAIAKLAKGTGIKPSTGTLKPVSLAGDLISNSLYFAMADAADKKKTLMRGTLLGLGAGVGALILAKPLGLDARIVAATPKTKVLTLTWYLAAGIVAATVINALGGSRVSVPSLKLQQIKTD